MSALTAEPTDPIRRRDGVGAWLLVAFGAIGLGISIYLTTLHYAGLAPVCTTGGIVNCASVLKSSYSNVPGTSIPVTVPGMLWCLVSISFAAASLVQGRRGLPEPRWLRPGHALWAGIGMLSVLYFIYAEVVALHEICEWCTGVHILVFLSLITALVRLQPAYATGPEELP